MFLFLVAGLQLPLRQSGARASVCGSRINVLTRDPQAAQSPVPSRSESAAKQPPESAHFLPSTAIQTSHRDDDDDDDDTHTRALVSKQSRTMRYYTKGRGQNTLQKNAPHFLRFAIAGWDGRFAGGMRSLAPFVLASLGGFCYNHNTRSPWSSLASPHPVWRGRGETGHLARSCLSPPRDSEVTPISGDPRASPHHPTLRRPRG